MKLTKKKNDAGSIRKVWNNDKTRCYGVVGVIRDLIQSGILEYSDYNDAIWCFIRGFNADAMARSLSREEALRRFDYGFGIFLKGIRA